MRQAGELLADVEEGVEAEGEGGADQHIARVAIVVPGQLGEAAGVRAGEAGDRERPAAVISAIGEALDQGVTDFVAESTAVAAAVALVLWCISAARPWWTLTSTDR